MSSAILTDAKMVRVKWGLPIRALVRMAHFSDDVAVAKMGHPISPAFRCGPPVTCTDIKYFAETPLPLHRLGFGLAAPVA